MKNKNEKTKILFTMPVELKEELSKEAEADFRSLNNYILWVLLNRNEKK
ncbi:hypothetical protein J3A84_05150 [Proteiniclasticum sp. SCR006]|uniref:Arc-like DNA binding domain-containing protein n=1 Tax=Proteiniclasticum aestuarii TaxID=2817862 RepID=A0A939HAJ9_9CLOT|nr:hypothetical protein [Proteiniclasticum aestuarii]MBO1264427.1 hypothetical protein [Proteiniclasticum aestuarii]